MSVAAEVVGNINRGLVVLLGVGRGDTEADARYLARKVANLRIFSDEAGKFNLSTSDIGGEILVISQFTLLANTDKGHRPSFIAAAPPKEAQPLIEKFTQLLHETGLKVESGRFREHMLVEIHNDGPVTILLDSRSRLANH